MSGASGARSFRQIVPELRDIALHYALRGLPTEACSALGAHLGGWLGRRGHPVAASRSLTLLRTLRPDLNTVAIETACARLWANIGRTFAEFSVIHRMLPQGRATLSDPALLDGVYADQRPLILCFVHLGNWEVLGRQVVQHPRIYPGRPFVAVVEPPGNRAHAFVAARQRGVLPVELAPMGPRVWHTVAETLRRPGGIAWLAADEFANRRVYAPHFGRRVRTDGNLGKIVRLAAATGARIMPIYNERLPGTRFVTHVGAPLEIPSGRLGAQDLATQVMRLDAIFAPIIRQHVDQWYMASEFRADPADPVFV